MKIQIARRHSTKQEGAQPEFATNVAFPWVIRLRYGLALIEIAIAAAAAAVGAKIPFLLVGIIVSLTVVSNLVVKPLGERISTSLQSVIAGLFCLDILSLTGIFMLTGGASNPFTLLYLVQITLSATILSKYWTWLLGLLSVVCFGSLFRLYLPIPALEGHHPPETEDLHLIGMWVGFSAAAFLITFFSGKISEVMRRREIEMSLLQQQLAKRERLASLATLAAGAAHELSTPLATIAVVAKELEKYASEFRQDETVAEDSRLIRSEIERCRRILEGMGVQGAEVPGEMPALTTTDLLVDQLKAHLVPEFAKRVEVRNETQGASIVIPVAAVTRALSALIKNALEAGTPGDVVLRIERDDSIIRFSVQDEGEGMSEEVLQRVAEPFFTTKPPGSGMGLGTFLVRALAEQLGGTLEFHSSKVRGTTAMLELPIEYLGAVNRATAH